MSVSTLSVPCFLPEMLQCPLAVETKGTMDLFKWGTTGVAALSLPNFRECTKTSKCQRKIYAGDCGVLLRNNTLMKALTFGQKLSGRKVRQGNLIIKVTPLPSWLLFSYDFASPSDTFSHCESVTCMLLIPLEGRAKKAFGWIILHKGILSYNLLETGSHFISQTLMLGFKILMHVKCNFTAPTMYTITHRKH